MSTTFEFHEVNGIRMHVAVDGPADGELVVLLHGFPEFWQGMQAPLEAFAAAGYRVVAPDQRGYNLTDKPAGIESYTLDTLADDVLGLIDAMGYDTAHVIGHDWGAAVTWWLAARNPERLGRVAVINVPHPLVMAAELRRNPRQLLKSWYMLAIQFPWLPEQLFGERTSGQLAQTFARTANPGSFTPEYVDDLRRAWAEPGAAQGMLNWYRAALRHPSPPPPDARIHQPLLILWGVNDVAVGRQLAEQSARMCDEPHIIYFDDATHWLLHDEPVEASRLLVAWVRGEDL